MVLCNSPSETPIYGAVWYGPYNLVLLMADFIQILIEKKQLVEAVRFIFEFKLMDKLPAVQLLKEFVEDAKKCPEAIWRLQISLDEKVP